MLKAIAVLPFLTNRLVPNSVVMYKASSPMPLAGVRVMLGVFAFFSFS